MSLLPPLPTPPWEKVEANPPQGLRHELIAGPIEDTGLDAEVQRRIEEWVEAAKPGEAIEKHLITQAATASIRLDRAFAREQASAADAVRSAAADWTARRKACVRKAAQDLAERPKEILELLTSTALGCDWLLARWQPLGKMLEENGCWTLEERKLAQSLLGLIPNPSKTSHQVASPLWRDAMTLDPRLDPAESDRYFGSDTSDMDPEHRLALARARLGNPATARARLIDQVRTEINRLTALRDPLWRDVDARLQAEAIQFARCPVDAPGATALRRYEAAQSAILHRSLRELARRQEARKKECAGQSPVVSTASSSRVARPLSSTGTIGNGRSRPSAIPDLPPKPIGAPQPQGPRINDANPDFAATSVDGFRLSGRAPERTKGAPAASQGQTDSFRVALANDDRVALGDLGNLDHAYIPISIATSRPSLPQLQSDRSQQAWNRRRRRARRA